MKALALLLLTILALGFVSFAPVESAVCHLRRKTVRAPTPSSPEALRAFLQERAGIEPRVEGFDGPGSVEGDGGSGLGGGGGGSGEPLDMLWLQDGRLSLPVPWFRNLSGVYQYLVIYSTPQEASDPPESPPPSSAPAPPILASHLSQALGFRGAVAGFLPPRALRIVADPLGAAAASRVPGVGAVVPLWGDREAVVSDILDEACGQAGLGQAHGQNVSASASDLEARVPPQCRDREGRVLLEVSLPRAEGMDAGAAAALTGEALAARGVCSAVLVERGDGLDGERGGKRAAEGDSGKLRSQSQRGRNQTQGSGGWVSKGATASERALGRKGLPRGSRGTGIGATAGPLPVTTDLGAAEEQLRRLRPNNIEVCVANWTIPIPRDGDRAFSAAPAAAAAPQPRPQKLGPKLRPTSKSALKASPEADPDKGSPNSQPPPSSPCVVRRSSPHSLLLSLPLPSLPPAVSLLASLPFVEWVDLHHRPRTANMWAVAAVQGWDGDDVDSTGGGDGQYGQVLSSLRPFWARGIDGRTQIAGGGDTGLDLGSCFFLDPSVPDPGPTHRKVIGYRALADDSDGNGHGTHTMGSVVGGCLQCGNGVLFNGAAPAARIAFTDMGEGPSRSLVSPPGGLGDYYGWGYDLGARVHSDSWGSVRNEYTVASQEADAFLWGHQDLVAVFAAGNDGDELGIRGSTIGAPATAKNVISVGASQGRGSDPPDPDGSTYSFSIAAPPELRGRTLRALQGTFGPPFSSEALGLSGNASGANGQSITVTVASPEDGCVNGTAGQRLAAAPGFPPLNGSMVLIQRGGCIFLDKALAAQDAGAAGVLIYNGGTDEASGTGYPRMAAPTGRDDDVARLTVPTGALPYSLGALLSGRVGPGLSSPPPGWSDGPHPQPGPVVLRLLGPSPTPDVPYENVASFSSFGPTFDLRVKPDVVAPGESIRSAYGGPDLPSPKCATAALTGTSMSAPQAAGAAVLIRDYFARGFYPGGKEGSGPPRNVSGPLVKAVLLGGAAPMQGYTETGLPLEDAPSYRQGFGRVDLMAALPLAGMGNSTAAAATDASPESPDSLEAQSQPLGPQGQGGTNGSALPFQLWVWEGRALQQGDKESFCVQIPNVSAANATLSPAPPPAPPPAPTPDMAIFGSATPDPKDASPYGRRLPNPWDLFASRPSQTVAPSDTGADSSSPSDSGSGTLSSPPPPSPSYPSWRSLTATLAWYDLPSSPSSGYRSLVNDLDLDLEAAPGEAWPDWGAAARPDRRNTVERGSVREPRPGSSYLVTVTAFEIPWVEGPSDSGQKYSLAIWGPAGMTVCRCGAECNCSKCPSRGPNATLPSNATAPGGLSALLPASGLVATPITGPAVPAPAVPAAPAAPVPPLSPAAPAPAPAAPVAPAPPPAAAAPPPPSPCDCSPDGMDVGSGVATGREGCGCWVRGASAAYCYVRQAAACPTARPSGSFPGAGLVQCPAGPSVPVCGAAAQTPQAQTPIPATAGGPALAPQPPPTAVPKPSPAAPLPAAAAPAPAPAAPDPCACSVDGTSGGVQTGRIGCGAFLQDLGISQQFCYVAQPKSCATATMSSAFPGAGLRICG